MGPVLTCLRLRDSMPTHASAPTSFAWIAKDLDEDAEVLAQPVNRRHSAP
jgi:hypothetical protein